MAVNFELGNGEDMASKIKKCNVFSAEASERGLIAALK